MANFSIVITVNSTQAVAGAKAVQGSLNSLEGTVSSLGKALKRMFAGAVLAQGLNQAVKTISDFSQQMSTLEAVLRDTGDLSASQFKTMRDTALEMGLTTRFSATQAAEGMTILAKAGFNAQESMEALTGTLNLAQAGGISLGQSADIVTSVLRGFNMATSQSAEVVDVLTRAANASNADVVDFGQSMKFVAPIAAGVNMSLKDTVAALEVLSNAGIKASMAGTGLRRVIGALEGPNATQIKQLKQLDLSARGVKVSSDGLIAVMTKMGMKTNDVGRFLNMFGQRGGPAAMVITKYKDKVKEYAKQNDEAAGAGIRLAKIMNDNLAGAIDRARAAFGVLIIKMGDIGAENALRGFFEGLANAIRFAARHAEAFASSAGVLATGLLIAFGATTKAMNGLKALGIAMRSNPVTVWVTAITLLITALVLFRDELHIGGNGLASFGDLARAAGQAFWEFRNNVLLAMGDIVGKTDFSFKELIGNALTWVLAIVDNILKVFDGVAGVLRGLGLTILNFFNFVGVSIKFAFQTVAKFMVDNFDKAFNWLIEGWNKVAAAISAPLIPQFDKDGAYKALGLGNITAEDVKQAGKDLGSSFVEGMVWQGENGLSAGFNKIIDRANEIAMSRIQGKGEPTTPTTPMPPEAPFGPPDSFGKKRGKEGPSFGKWLAEISQENQLLRLNSREYEIQTGIMKLYEMLGGKLTDVQERIADRVLRENQARKEQAQLYDQIRQPLEDNIAQQQALNVLYDEGRINIREYNKALDELRMQSFLLGNTLQGGLQAGLLQVKAEIMDVSNAAAGVMTNAFRGAEDMLVNFTTTGKLNFSGFVDSVLQDVTRLMLRMAMLKAFGGLWGGLAGGGGGSGASIVGAGGPSSGWGEVFGATGFDGIVGGSGGTDSQRFMVSATPGERLSIQTPQQQRDAAKASTGQAPIIKIINVTDPNEAAAAMESARGEQVILNVIKNNRNAVRSTIA